MSHNCQSNFERVIAPFLTACLITLGSPSGFAAPITVSYPGPFSGTFLVPAGVTSLSVEVWGGGGTGSLAAGGAGGFASGDFPTAPGESISINAAGGGLGFAGGFGTGHGGNSAVGPGGGASSIGGLLAVIVAGGGGGAGIDYTDLNPFAPFGGAGGGLVGAPGGGFGGNEGGHGGTQSGAGLGGTGSFLNGANGVGGNGGSNGPSENGGGGGGYFGGGAGGFGNSGNGGGGGGSGYLEPSILNGLLLAGNGATPPNMASVHYIPGTAVGGHYTSGYYGGNGLVVISYSIPEPASLRLFAVAVVSIASYAWRARKRKA